MPTNRYLGVSSTGQPTEVVPAITSSGAASAGQIIALNAAGALDATMLPSGVGATAVTAAATAAISAGMAINVYSNAGVLSVRPADNTAVGSEANGYAPSAIASGASGTVNLGEGLINGLSGIVVGTNYFLGTVGAFTATVPATAGNLIQYCGKGMSTTELLFIPSTFTVVVA